MISGMTGLTTILSSPSEQTRYVFGVVLILVLCTQFVIYASTRKRPWWFVVSELIAMVCTFAAGATLGSLKTPGDAIMVSGLFVLFGFVEFNVATAVYLYMRERVDSATFLRRYWYIPTGVLLLFMFLFVAAERANRQNGPGQTEILQQSQRNGAIGTKNLDLTEVINQKADISIKQRERQLTLLDELSDAIVKLVVPIRQDLKDIKAEQQRAKIRDQKLDTQIQELKRGKYNGFQ
jgi:hypothetical protein